MTLGYLLRWFHLIRSFACFHRAVTLFDRVIACDCGKVFWEREA